MISGVTFVDKNSVYQIPGFIYDEERPEFNCLIPVYTGDFWIVDCWICDKDGNVHPHYSVAGVPIHTEQMVRIGRKPANLQLQD